MTDMERLDQIMQEAKTCPIKAQLLISELAGMVARRNTALADIKTEISRNVNIKNLVYSFLNLPYITRQGILLKFNLLAPDDDGLAHVKIIEKIINKAKDRECLEEFLKEINRLHQKEEMD